MIKIKCNEIIYEAKNNISLEDFIEQYNIPNKNTIVSANVDNVPQDLTYTVNRNCTVDFLDLKTSNGQKIYKTSLSFLFIKAVFDVMKRKVELCHTLSKGQYCEIEGLNIVTPDQISKIKERMTELIQMDIPFERSVLQKEDAIALFNKINKKEHVKLLNTTYREIVTVYKIDGFVSHFNYKIVPSTRYIRVFDIVPENKGVVLLCPSSKDPLILIEHKKQTKLLSAFEETKKWGKIMNVGYVSDLNEKIMNGEYKELVTTIEGLHEMKMSEMAQTIKRENKRIVLIAGPSSSGKTSTSKRIAIHLRARGLKPIAISVDDYFVNRDRTPLDVFGEKDYESIYAVDLEQFNKDLSSLLNGNEVELPRYNFKLGAREYKGDKLRITEDQPIIIEGIHGLNPLLTQSISEDTKFKIYISPITQLNLDRHNRISSTDSRLIRRIVRDFKFRGHTAEDTLKMWGSVRRGEEKNIFPYQEEADIIFNSTLIYEISVLKKYLEPLLITVPMTSKYYADAKRLLNLASYFIQLNDESAISTTSIICEFIGGSALVD